jgi:N-carbamoyl-L-amino-acid hydrolase
MELRRDALTAFSEICLGVEAIARHRSGVGTVGYAKVEPGSRNTIPGRVRFSIEFRHLSEAGLEKMDKALLQAAGELRSERGVQIDIEEICRNSPVRFDHGCIAAIEAAAARLGYPHCRMSSGAGHDACNVSLVAPTAMIFIPCRDGVSHRESEFTTPEMCAAGANVLLQAVLTLANRRRSVDRDSR